MTSRGDELKGRLKEGAGKVTGDKELEAEGKKKAEGARAGRKIKGAAREAGGAIKEAVSKVTGDKSAEAEGKGEKLKGKSERAG